MAKIRDSRIELLRIVLMWTVMAHHFVVHNADSVSVFPGSFTRFFYNIFFYPIGRTAVGCFVAITIWFVAGKAGYSIKQAVKQIASIEGTVLFYSIALGFFFMLRGDIQVSPTNLIDIFAPILTGSSWWFVTVYAWLVFLLPFLFRLCMRWTRNYIFIYQSFWSSPLDSCVMCRSFGFPSTGY